MNFLGVCSAIYAIKTLDITIAISIGYLTPVLTSILAILILKEKFSFKSMLALLISILGAIITAKSVISNSVTTLGISAAVISAIAWSIHNLLLKTQAMRDHWTKQTFLTLICTSLISLPFALATWTPLTNKQVSIFILLAILYTFSKMFLVKGLNRIPLLFFAPISFMKLTFNASIAYFFFKEVISMNTIIGSALIIFATLILMFSTKKIIQIEPALKRRI
jgi:drug/metabolite transporter (DMT)-like permease